MELVNKILKLLSEYRITFKDEKALQSDLARLFVEHSIKFDREVRLDDENIVDFMLEEGLAVECKIKGGTTKLIRQLARYASHEKVKSILVITNMNKLAALPEVICSKKIFAHVFSVL